MPKKHVFSYVFLFNSVIYIGLQVLTRRAEAVIVTITKTLQICTVMLAWKMCKT